MALALRTGCPNVNWFPDCGIFEIKLRFGLRGFLSRALFAGNRILDVYSYPVVAVLVRLGAWAAADVAL
jgi:hypothetical protein